MELKSGKVLLAPLLSVKRASVSVGDLPAYRDIQTLVLSMEPVSQVSQPLALIAPSLLERLPTFKGLRHLTVDMSGMFGAYPIPDTLFDCLKDCKALEELVLIDACGLHGDFLQDIASLPKLRSLELRKCNHITDDNLCRVTSCNTLEKLVIDDCYASGDFLQGIASLPNLRALELRKCREITDYNFSRVTSCNTLEKLVIYDCYTAGGFLRDIGLLPGLKTLDLRDCLYIQGENYSYVPMAKGLETLLLETLHFPKYEHCLQAMRALPSLRESSLEESASYWIAKRQNAVLRNVERLAQRAPSPSRQLSRPTGDGAGPKAEPA
jgi:hypothetical protein